MKTATATITIRRHNSNEDVIRRSCPVSEPDDVRRDVVAILGWCMDMTCRKIGLGADAEGISVSFDVSVSPPTPETA